MYRIHSLVGVSHSAKHCNIRSVNANKSPKIPRLFHNGQKNGKVIRNPCPGPDHHKRLITSRGSPLAHAYHVWSTSVTAIVSYPALAKQQESQTSVVK